MSIKQYIREKIDPSLTKMLLITAPAPAGLPLQEIQLNTPFIEQEIVTILDKKQEPITDNITLTDGC